MKDKGEIFIKTPRKNNLWSATENQKFYYAMNKYFMCRYDDMLY